MARRRSALPQLVVVLFAGASLAALGWAGFSAEVPPEAKTDAIVIADTSMTMEQNTMCSDIANTIDDVLGQASDHPVHLLWGVTGHSASSLEPELTVEGTVFEAVSLLKHNDKATGPIGVLRAQVLAACEAAVPRKVSPLHAAVLAAVGQLRPNDASTCGTEFHHCKVVMRTDGAEEYFAPILRRLAGQTVETQPSIDNRGVDVVLCGISKKQVKKGSRPLPDLAAVKKAWLPEFTDPLPGADRAALQC